MQFAISVSVLSTLSWCGVTVFLGAIHMLALVMSFNSCTPFLQVVFTQVLRVDGLWRLDVRECCVSLTCR